MPPSLAKIMPLAPASSSLADSIFVYVRLSISIPVWVSFVRGIVMTPSWVIVSTFTAPSPKLDLASVCAKFYSKWKACAPIRKVLVRHVFEILFITPRILMLYMN